MSTSRINRFRTDANDPISQFNSSVARNAIRRLRHEAFEVNAFHSAARSAALRRRVVGSPATWARPHGNVQHKAGKTSRSSRDRRHPKARPNHADHPG